MATKATLINDSGQKKVVDSGSRDAQDLFGQGFKLMGASPVSNNTFKRDLTGAFQRKEGLEKIGTPGEASQFSDIQQVGEVGQPGSFLEGRRNPLVDGTQTGIETPQAPVTPASPTSPTNPADSFNLLLVDALKKAQGVDGSALAKKQRLLQRAVLGRQEEITPEELRTLSPAQQSAIRSGDVQALRPEIDELAFEVKRAEIVISNFEAMFEKAKTFGEDFQAKMVAPENVVSSYAKLIESGQDMSTVLANANEKTRQAVLGMVDPAKLQANELEAQRSQLKLKQEFEGKDTGPSIAEQIAANKAGGNIVNGKVVFGDGATDPITGVETDPTKVIAGYNFTSYATDPNWGNSINNIMNNIPDLTDATQVDSYIKSIAPNSPINGQDFIDVSQEMGIPVNLLASIAQHESGFGTLGVGARTHNPGNVGNTDDGSQINWGDWKNGLRAVARNANRRAIDTDGTTPTNDFDKKALIARLGKAIYGTRISDNEREFVGELVADGIKGGKTQADIVDAFLGYNIDNNKEFAQGAKELLIQNAGDDGLAGQDMFGLAQLINNNKLEQAITKIESVANRNAKALSPDDFISEATVRTATQRANGTITLIDELKSSPIGVVSGTMEKFLRKLKGKDAAKIETQITQQIAKMRNELSGSAVTPEEEKFLRPLVPDLNDQPDIFMQKLENLKNAPLVRYNNNRDSVGMPQLNEEQLLSKGLRASLYGGQETGDTQTGDIRVKLNSSGETGSIPASEFDSKLYTKI